MPSITKSNSDNFLTWQKVVGNLPLSRLQAEGIQSCAEGYNLSKLSLANTYTVGDDGLPRSIYWSSDGLNFYYNGNTFDKVYQKTVSIPYDISTVVSSQTKVITEDTTSVYDVRFNASGTKCYISGATADIIYQYSLTAWDISTLSYDTKSLDVSGKTSSLSGFCISDTNVYAGTANTILQYSITGGDLSTSSFVHELSISGFNGIYSIHYRSDEKLYYVGFSSGSSSRRIHELSISGGNLIGGTITQNDIVPIPGTNMPGLFIKDDGSSLWVMDGPNDKIYEYWVGCP